MEGAGVGGDAHADAAADTGAEADGAAPMRFRSSRGLRGLGSGTGQAFRSKGKGKGGSAAQSHGQAVLGAASGSHSSKLEASSILGVVEGKAVNMEAGGDAMGSTNSA